MLLKSLKFTNKKLMVNQSRYFIKFDIREPSWKEVKQQALAWRQCRASLCKSSIQLTPIKTFGNKFLVSSN